jgi:tetratricopeptide (TPR) repeat protein
MRSPGFFLVFSLVLSLLLGACATVDARRLPAQVGDLPKQAEIVDTPYFPQVDAYCGPAALATLLQQRGLAVTPEALASLVYLPGRRGSLQVEMVAAARRHGQLAVQLGATLEALLREVAGGSPVLILQNLGLDWAPSWHYAVVVGYDLVSEEFILRSGPEPRMRMGFSVFDRTWSRAGRWAVVLPPLGRIPATADRDALAKALPAFERQQARRALAYYEAAAGRWPDDVRFAFGRANALYSLGEKPAAGEAWQRLLVQFPGYVPALNNLATWRLEEGRSSEARDLAERAVAAGGPWLEEARATLQEIEAAGKR